MINKKRFNINIKDAINNLKDTMMKKVGMKKSFVDNMKISMRNAMKKMRKGSK